MGLHPECLQVWDKSPTNGTPYFVHAAHVRGYPRELVDHDIDHIARMSSDAEHQGRQGWVDDYIRDQQARFDDAETAYAGRISDWFGRGGEGRSRAEWVSGSKLTIATSIPSNQNHNLRRRRKR